MSDASPFILDLRSTFGRELALAEHEHELVAREWTTWLRIRSDITGFVPPTINLEDDELTGFVPPVFERDGLALLATTRDPGDLSGRAIGLFHGRVHAEELDQLRAVVEGTPWAELPRPVGGDFNAPTLQLSYEREGLLIRRGFNACSSNFVAAIRPLWDLLERHLSRAHKSPASSLELAVALEQPGQLRLSLRARGMGHLALTDPRLPTADGGRLRLRVGEIVSRDPHAQARSWVELPIPPAPEGSPRSLILPPRGRFDLSVPWAPAQPGVYRIEASWRDYGGPLEPVAGQTPFMPMPATGPSSLGSGPYPIRGALFARRRVEPREGEMP